MSAGSSDERRRAKFPRIGGPMQICRKAGPRSAFRHRSPVPRVTLRRSVRRRVPRARAHAPRRDADDRKGEERFHRTDHVALNGRAFTTTLVSPSMREVGGPTSCVRVLLPTTQHLESSALDDPAAQHGNVVADRLHLTEDVGGEQHCLARSWLGTQARNTCSIRDRARRRLVEQQEIGPARERSDQQNLACCRGCMQTLSGSSWKRSISSVR
jgi:hypothetical protein